MGGEVIRGVGNTRPLPMIPRGVEANAGPNPRQRLQPLPVQNLNPQPLVRRWVLAPDIQAMVDQLVEQIYRDN